MMSLRFLLIVLFCYLLQACNTTHHYSIKSYKRTTDEIQKTYKLPRSDLILTYNLAKIDNSNCIYSKTLGLVANEEAYAKEYLNKFKTASKAQSNIAKEARKKITKICDVLLLLQNKYRILSTKNEQYIKRLSNMNLLAIDPKNELSKLDHIISYVPLLLPAYKAHITSEYGNRYHSLKHKYKFHCGTDFAARHKAPIYASAHGRVSFVGTQNGYGKIVEISHGNGIKTKYAHLSVILVSKGQKVIRSQIVGLQGKTGNARGEHLHFEVRLVDKHLNPKDFIGHNYDF